MGLRAAQPADRRATAVCRPHLCRRVAA